MEINNSDFSLFNEILDQLIALPKQKPKNYDEMLIFNRQCIDLSLKINSLSFSDCPSEIRHYLADTDIRFKDETYFEWQTKIFLDAIDMWKSKHRALI